ncbi:MAG: hypothetical protein HOO06_04475 [Bdellovibrionaceae bacterium]|jgi:hypothetical protein|nr:hypothetical protein [Pseudobdellovibrionaceae bacterium]
MIKLIIVFNMLLFYHFINAEDLEFPKFVESTESIYSTFNDPIRRYIKKIRFEIGIPSNTGKYNFQYPRGHHSGCGGKNFKINILQKVFKKDVVHSTMDKIIFSSCKSKLGEISIERKGIDLKKMSKDDLLSFSFDLGGVRVVNVTYSWMNLSFKHIIKKDRESIKITYMGKIDKGPILVWYKFVNTVKTTYRKRTFSIYTDENPVGDTFSDVSVKIKKNKTIYSHSKDRNILTPSQFDSEYQQLANVLQFQSYLLQKQKSNMWL